MYRAGVDATGPAYLGEAQPTRLAELLKPAGLHQRAGARDPGDHVGVVTWHGLPALSSLLPLPASVMVLRSTPGLCSFIAPMMCIYCINVAIKVQTV